jgi:hypothetical protein
MGREVKRVAIDFDWPLNKPWKGYICELYRESYKCPDCAGTGYSPIAKQLHDMWYGYIAFCPKSHGVELLTPENAAVRALAKRNCSTGENSTIEEAKRLCEHFNACIAGLRDGRVIGRAHGERETVGRCEVSVKSAMARMDHR